MRIGERYHGSMDRGRISTSTNVLDGGVRRDGTETFGHDNDTQGIEPNVSLCRKAIRTPATGYVALLL